MKKNLFLILSMLILSAPTLSLASQPLHLDEYLRLVQSQNKNLRAFSVSTTAAEDRFAAADLELSPVLTLQGNDLDDKSLQIFGPGVELVRNQVKTYSLGISKKFSSGTMAAVSTGVQGVLTDMSSNGTPSSVDTYSGFAQVSLTQSLWKDFFGTATRLRWQREAALRAQEKQTYQLQTQQALISAEAAFWDLIFAEANLKIREAGLERAKTILQWVQKRHANGIGDKADVLNAQGLTEQRELEFLNAQDDLRTAQQNVADQLEIKNLQELPSLQGDLNQMRSLQGDFAKNNSQTHPVRLDAYLSMLDAKAKAVIADESVDSLRPDLVLQGSYKTNGYADSVSNSWSHTTDPGHPVTSVGVQFRWLLDWETKGQARNSAKMDAVAASLKQERELLESDSSWSELLRKHTELKQKIAIAQKISQTQTAHAEAERQKLSRGRAITLDVITAEQSADEAQLTLTKLKTEMRKLESQGRLFVTMDGEILK